MEIPAIFASGRRFGGLVAHVPAEGGCLPPQGCRTVPFQDAAAALPRADERLPALVVDWGSLGARKFDERVVKAARLRGRDVWLMTWVADADDLMDAFNTVADVVVAPYHAIASRADMEDIASISDGTIPAIFVEGGRALARGGRPDGVYDALGVLESAGFPRAVVVDSDSSLSADGWASIAGRFPRTVPFVADPARTRGLFADVATPLRLRAGPRGTRPRPRGRPRRGCGLSPSPRAAPATASPWTRRTP